MKFCDNNKCQWHIEVADKINRLEYPKFLSGAEQTVERLTVKRIIVVETLSKKEFGFCESCANVAQLINEV